ncbi:FlgD immunoglobulin-like domain containing protein [Candidatus Neomarinimicrobiota bacterium]
MNNTSNRYSRNKNSGQARMFPAETIGLHVEKIFVVYRCCLAIVMFFMVPSFSQPGELNGQDTDILLSGPYLGQEPPGTVAQIFVPESLRSTSEWWWHRGLVFPSDGTEMYSDIYVGTDNEGITIRYQEIIDGIWTDPQRTDFDGGYAEASPTFLDNGNIMYFLSDKPGESNYRIWKTSRIDGTWLEPVAVRISLVTGLYGGWEISIAADETLYLRMSSVASNLDIYMCEKSGEGYAAPVRMSNNINSDGMDLAPFVAPDESYLIWSSSRSGGYGANDLYISFRDYDGEWSPAINMGSAVNTSTYQGGPSVSADGAYLFFNSDGNPHWIDASIIDDLEPLSIDQHGSNEAAPGEFGLTAAYPNPFNPSTTIRYDLPHASEVALIVYDLLGQEVARLVEGGLEPGYHQVQWDGKDARGSNVPSGIYIARLTTPAYTNSLKLVLLK